LKKIICWDDKTGSKFQNEIVNWLLREWSHEILQLIIKMKPDAFIYGKATCSYLLFYGTTDLLFGDFPPEKNQNLKMKFYHKTKNLQGWGCGL
jgi:hypothetical protein